MKKELPKTRLNQAQENQILHRIVDLTSSELDLHHVLDDIVHIMVEATSADSVFIYLLDEKNKELILMASKTPHEKEVGRITLRVGEGPRHAKDARRCDDEPEHHQHSCDE